MAHFAEDLLGEKMAKKDDKYKSVKQPGKIKLNHTFSSSTVCCAEYGEMTELMYVHFKKGDSVYLYRNVSKETWEKFISAESAGKFVNTVLKNYEFERMM